MGILGANRTEDLLVARNEIVSSFFSYRFCAEDFSELVGSIFMKFSGLIDNHKNLIYFFLFWWRHFRFCEIANFLNFRGSCCPDFSSKTIKATKLKFCVKVAKVWLSSWFHFQFCGSKGAEARLDMKIDKKISTNFLNILIRNFLLVNIF